MIRQIMICGDFSHDEFVELTDAVRQIEQRHPERVYEVACWDETGSTKEGRGLVERALRGPMRH